MWLCKGAQVRKSLAGEAGGLGMFLEVLATSGLLGIQSDRHAVCGRRATAVDRWYSHLLVASFILLPYPFYHSPLHLLSGEAGGSDVSFGGLRLVLRGCVGKCGTKCSCLAPSHLRRAQTIVGLQPSDQLPRRTSRKPQKHVENRPSHLVHVRCWLRA